MFYIGDIVILNPFSDKVVQICEDTELFERYHFNNIVSMIQKHNDDAEDIRSTDLLSYKFEVINYTTNLNDELYIKLKFVPNFWFPAKFFVYCPSNNSNSYRVISTLCFERGSKVILTTDDEKIKEWACGEKYFFNQMMNLRGQVCTIELNTNDYKNVILEELNGWYIETSLLSAWYEGYIPPKINRVEYCEKCGDSFEIKENENLYLEDKKMCPRCRKRHFVTPYHRFQPHIDFYKKKNDDDLFLGVELEVDDGGELDSKAKMVMEIMNKKEGKHFVYCSHDSSLSNGFEIITQPATLNYHKSIKNDYKQCFKDLISAGYRSHQTNTAGIHVHFSREFFADNEEDNLAKLLYLVEKFWNEITIFSRRNYRELERYSKKIETSSKDFIASYNKADTHEGHYYAVNICNNDTIELRMFRGTLNINAFIAILEFVDGLVRVVRNKTINELQSLEFEEILTPLAKRYYKSRLNAYAFKAE